MTHFQLGYPLNAQGHVNAWHEADPPVSGNAANHQTLREHTQPKDT
jgi:hypothetical protein